MQIREPFLIIEDGSAEHPMTINSFDYKDTATLFTQSI